MIDEVWINLRRDAAALPEPPNLFSGRRLPKNFVLPDNILAFFHDFTSPAPNAHGRWTLVVPFDRMDYFLERRRVRLAPGELLLIAPHTLRYLHPRSEGYRRLFVTFELVSAHSDLPEGRHWHPGKAEWELLARFLAAYAAESAEMAAVWLFGFLKAMPAAPEPDSGEPLLPAVLMRAIEFIGLHPGAPLNNAAVAEAAGISESHLRALFYRHTGLTLGRYIARQRLDAACYRLKHTTLSIAEIAVSCGFANGFVFSAFFRRQTGLAPLRYRRQYAPGSGVK